MLVIPCQLVCELARGLGQILLAWLCESACLCGRLLLLGLWVKRLIHLVVAYQLSYEFNMFPNV
jgi:hypothetical protein